MADDDLPIDVHYDKLIDWLVDRKKVSKDWRKKLAGVHAKLSELARELPGTLIRAHGLGVPDSSLVDAEGEPPRWDYFRAVLVRDRIVAGADLRGDADGREAESLARSAAADPERPYAADDSRRDANEKTRGLFGRLAGKAKAWDDVVRAYEKDALHLTECGATMTRTTDHEVPFRRKESAKLAKQLGDAERRETENRRNAVAAKEKFARVRADVFGSEVGSEGDGRGRFLSDDETPRNEAGFRALVDGLVARLDSVFDAAVAAARDDAVGDAAEHYARWTEWAHGERIRGVSDGDAVTVESLTPYLSRLRAMSPSEAEALGGGSRDQTRKNADDASTSDAVTVPPPSTGIDWDVGATDSGPAPPAVEIDWDLGGAAGEASAKVEPPSGGVDWDVDASAVETAVEIDWDVGDVAEVDAAGGSASAAEIAVETAVEIDWDVGGVVVEDAGDETPGPSEPVREPDANEAGASAEDATNAVDETGTRRSVSASLGRALADREFRARVLDDLLELRAFLAQRASDASSGESASLLATAPAELRALGADPQELRRLAAACEAPVRVLSADGARRLLLLSASERARARLASDLFAASRLEGKLLACADEARERQAETRRLLQREARRAEAVGKALGEVKRFAEEAISAMYKGRTVHIIGEINNALG